MNNVFLSIFIISIHLDCAAQKRPESANFVVRYMETKTLSNRLIDQPTELVMVFCTCGRINLEDYSSLVASIGINMLKNYH